MELITLIAFLGNHGTQYKKNRHNAAWLFADSLPSLRNLNWQKKFNGQFASFSIDDRHLYIIKPETFMNLSGESIAHIASFYKIPAEQILIVHDELELPTGTVSLKWSGGLGGHNGLRSTKASLGSADFWRLRFGIGRPEHNDISAWVLSDFSFDESIRINQIFDIAAPLFDTLLRQDPETLLPKWKKAHIQEIKK